MDGAHAGPWTSFGSLGRLLVAWAPPPWRSRPTTWPWSPTQMTCCRSSTRPPRRWRPQRERSLDLILTRDRQPSAVLSGTLLLNLLYAYLDHASSADRAKEVVTITQHRSLPAAPAAGAHRPIPVPPRALAELASAVSTGAPRRQVHQDQAATDRARNGCARPTTEPSARTSLSGRTARGVSDEQTRSANRSDCPHASAEPRPSGCHHVRSKT
jgi:hypothetical protein